MPWGSILSPFSLVFLEASPQASLPCLNLPTPVPATQGVSLCWEWGWGQGPRDVPQGLAPPQRRALWEDSTVWLCCCPSSDAEQASYDSLFSPASRCGGQWL